MADLSLGSTIAGCRLEAVAGRGGMGVVYRATQIALDRPVAVKAIAPQLAEDEAFRERFQREAHLAASIEHPNVIPIYEAGELEGTLYLIMRWVDGTDLRELLTEQGRLEPARAMQLLRPVASALGAAHRRGLIHRDVKPANVLIARGEDESDEHVYLTDFGIARRTTGEMAVTRTGVLVGTIDYTSPERIEGGRGSPASDIYAYGCMLFEVLTGHVPYDRPAELMKMYAHMNDPTPSARSEVPEIPERLDQITSRAMSKRPEDRFANAAELSAALARALEMRPGEVEFGDRLDRAELPTDEVEQPTALAPAENPTELAPAEDPTAVVPAENPTELAPAEYPTELAPAAEAIEPAPVVDHRATTAEISKPEPALRRRSRLVFAIPALVIIAVVAVIVITSGGGGPAQPTATGSPVSIKGIPLPSGSQPGPVWGEGPTVLVATGHGVLRVGAGGATTTFVTAGHPTDVGESAGKVWVTETSPNALVVFNTSGNQLRELRLGFSPASLAISSDAVWIAGTDSPSITRVDTTKLTASTVTAPNPAGVIGEAYGRLWVASPDGSLSALDDSGKPTVPAPQLPPDTIATGHSDGVWFLSASGTLTRVDPRTSPNVLVNGHYAEHPNQFHVTDPIPDMAPFEPSHLIWVGSRSQQTVIRVATTGPQNDQAVTTVKFHAAPGHLAVDRGTLWVAVPSQNEIYQITYR